MSLLQLPTPGQIPAPFTLLVVVVFQWQNPRAGVRRSSLAEWEKGREIGVGLGRGRKGEDILRAPINAQISNHSAGGGKKEEIKVVFMERSSRCVSRRRGDDFRAPEQKCGGDSTGARSTAVLGRCGRISTLLLGYLAEKHGGSTC